MAKRVLLIDDDPLFIQVLDATLSGMVDLRVVSIAEEAVRVSTEWLPDLVLLDVHLAPGDSFQVLDELTRTCRLQRTSVICLARGTGATTRVQRFGETVFGTLNRTSPRPEMLEAICEALSLRSLAAA